MKYVFRSIIAILTITLFSLSTSPSSAQNQSFETAEQVPSGIHTVISDGFWNQGKDEGFFRVIVVAGGVEHVSHRLYIQWLRSDVKSQKYELVRTVNVKELNLGQGYVLKVKTDFGDINSFKVNVTADSRGGKKTFAITVKGNGKYVIR